MRVLIVEDDKALGRGIVGYLRAEAFTIDWVLDGETAFLSLH